MWAAAPNPGGPRLRFVVNLIKDSTAKPSRFLRFPGSVPGGGTRIRPVPQEGHPLAHRAPGAALPRGYYRFLVLRAGNRAIPPSPACPSSFLSFSFNLFCLSFLFVILFF